MKATVSFIGRTSIEMGRSEIEVELKDGARLADLMKHLLELFGLTAEAALVDRNRGGYTVLLNVNGKAANASTVLNNGDRIVVVPPTSGGT